MMNANVAKPPGSDRHAARQRTGPSPNSGSAASNDDEWDALFTAAANRPPTDQEIANWRSMPLGRRAEAVRRLCAIAKWLATPSAERGSASEAADDAGLGLKRFYQVAKLWSEEPSLSALGVYASSPEVRGSKFPQSVVDRLHADADAVIAEFPSASISDIVREVVARFQPRDAKLPSKNVLRQMVKMRMRRLALKRGAGRIVHFDLMPTCFYDASGSVYLLAMLLDESTKMILGHALSSSPDTSHLFSDVARDALTMIERPNINGIQWASFLDEVTMAVGNCVFETLDSASFNHMWVVFTIWRSPARVGNLARSFLKSNAGRKLSKNILSMGDLDSSRRDDESDVRPCVESAIYAYNDEVSRGFIKEYHGQRDPPGGLFEVLGFLASR